MKKHILNFLALLLMPTAMFAQFSGNALDFDGTNDQVVCSSVPALFSSLTSSDFTFEAWVNPRGAVFSRIFFAQPSTTNFTAVSTGGTNNIYFYVVANGTTYSIATTATLPQNQWTHVAARWTAATSTPEVFFNGVLQAGVAGGSSSTGTNGLMTLGTRPGGSQYFNGALDEARLWSEARSACEISSNVNRSLNGAEANLLFTYNCNQGTGGGTNTGITSLPDLSGNANTGTLTNFALTGTSSNWILSAASVTSTGSSVGGYAFAVNDSICSGGSYTFPDGSTQNNITAPVVQTSNIPGPGGCDTVITTSLSINPGPQPTINGPAPVCEFSPAIYAASMGAGSTYLWQVTGGAITGGQGTNIINVLWGAAGPGTVAVSETSANGCDSTTTLNLVILPGYAQSESATVCMGGSYTYPDGSTDSSITSVTTHQSIFQSALGCDSVITTTVTPNPSYQVNDSVNVCRGADFTFPDGFTQMAIQANFSHTSQLQTSLGCDSVIVTDVYVTVIDTAVTYNGIVPFHVTNPQPGATFQWYECSNGFNLVPGETGDTVTFPMDTLGLGWTYSYAVEITLNGCVDTSDCHTVVTVSNDPSAAAFSIELYPNPTRDLLNVKVGMTDAGKWEVFSTLGNRIMGGEVQGAAFQLGVADLPAGMYLLEVTGSEGKVARRFIKK